MNDFIHHTPEVLRDTAKATEYSQMSEASLLAERERLLLLKKMADEATDFDQWSRNDQDEALNASKQIFEIQDILNSKIDDQNQSDALAAK